MRPTLLLLMLSWHLLSQTTVTLTGPASARPGSTISSTVVLGGQPAPAALQWTVTPPPGWSVTPAIGAAGTAADKKLSCHAPSGICLLYGLNQTIIQAGAVATYQIQIPPSAPAGLVQIPLTNLYASTALGASIQVSSPTFADLRRLPSCHPLYA